MTYAANIALLRHIVGYANMHHAPCCVRSEAAQLTEIIQYAKSACFIST